MDLVPFGKRCGLMVPRANLGGMRFPPDIDEAVAVVRCAIDAGMRYIDASRLYNDCELVFARALKDGYRDKVILSTKWSPWAEPDDDGRPVSADQMRRQIELQMKRLEVDYLDFFQIWGIQKREQFDRMTRKGGALHGIFAAMAEGVVGHTGLTTHDDVDGILSYIDDLDWCEVILISYNLLDMRYERVLQAAHRRGIGTVLMNPLAGGRLADDSALLKPLVDEMGAGSLPDLALRFLFSNPHVDCIISGVRNRQDVYDTVASAEAPPYDPDQMQRIRARIAAIAKTVKGFCTACSYCMPCPHGVNIPEIMGCIHDARYWGLVDAAKARYRRITNGADAEACAACGECTAKCTQKLDIPKELQFARTLFTEK